MRVLLVDNYDSFTWNVADLLGRLGADVDVVRNDAADVPDLLARGHDAIVLSPGPGRPDGAGVTIELATAAIVRELPLLGICLGMQAIGVALGGRVRRLPRVVHGSASLVEHDGAGVHRGLHEPFPAGRYHSLVVDEGALPDDLVVTARTSDGIPMGVRHVTAPAIGMQYHPESILTPAGDVLLANFLGDAADRRGLDFRPRSIGRAA